jgi:hypothetical protein
MARGRGPSRTGGGRRAVAMVASVVVAGGLVAGCSVSPEDRLAADEECRPTRLLHNEELERGAALLEDEEVTAEQEDRALRAFRAAALAVEREPRCFTEEERGDAAELLEDVEELLDG